MKLKKLSVIIFAIVASFLLSSCLTCEKKEYTITLKGKTNGEFSIKYINIMSKKDKEDLTAEDEAKADYNELMDKYINADEVEKGFPGCKMTSKRLFEENGKLCGEIIFEFTDLAQVKIFQYNKKSPFQYYISALGSETYLSSNGNKAPDFFPVINWENKVKIMTLSTAVNEPNQETTSLLSYWKK